MQAGPPADLDACGLPAISAALLPRAAPHLEQLQLAGDFLVGAVLDHTWGGALGGVVYVIPVWTGTAGERAALGC